LPRISIDIRERVSNLLVVRVGYGNGGWVGVDGLGLPGPLYARFRESGGRLRVSEIYLDASGNDGGISPSDLRGVPLSSLETLVNADAEHGRVLDRMDAPAPDLSTLASYFAATVNYAVRNDWVAASFAAQLPGSGVRVRRQTPRQWKVRDVDRDFRLRSGPGDDGLTDEFLADVARAYRAAVARGERPNVAIHEQTGYPLRTVQRWVYTARLKGIMPRGRRGRIG
jgi:hypothetical protein